MGPDTLSKENAQKISEITTQNYKYALPPIRIVSNLKKGEIINEEKEKREAKLELKLLLPMSKNPIDILTIHRSTASSVEPFGSRTGLLDRRIQDRGARKRFQALHRWENRRIRHIVAV